MYERTEKRGFIRNKKCQAARSARVASFTLQFVRPCGEWTTHLIEKIGLCRPLVRRQAYSQGLGHHPRNHQPLLPYILIKEKDIQLI